jgi:hypothetical protein
MTSIFSTEGLGASLRDVGALLLSLVDNVVQCCPHRGSREHRRCSG